MGKLSAGFVAEEFIVGNATRSRYSLLLVFYHVSI